MLTATVHSTVERVWAATVADRSMLGTQQKQLSVWPVAAGRRIAANGGQVIAIGFSLCFE